MNYSTLATHPSKQSVHVVVESPRGSTIKLKYDPSLEAFTLSRPLPTGMVFPFDWGFVPSTRASDGDPVDAVVLWDHASFPGVVLACRLIGVLAVEQNNKKHPTKRERNDRVFAVPIDAPQLASLESVTELPRRTQREIEAFFVASTAFENKALKFLGWSGPAAAKKLVQASLQGSEP
jgi:inorganic pyrophosphatase